MRVACAAVLAVLALHPLAARVLRGSSSGPVTPTRILIVGYGQSNMDVFFQGSNGSPQPAHAGTSFYNQDANVGALGIIPVPGADGLRILQNAVTTVTGLPSLSMVCAIGGSGLSNLISGGPNTNQTGYQGCINQVLANILPTDQVFFLWDQGETDSAAAELPDFYGPTVAALHANLAAAIGRTTATAPWITAGKGSVSPGATGTNFFSGAATPLSWNVLANSLKQISYIDPNSRWFTEYDYIRGTDGLHYDARGTALGGARFARYITNLMGFTTGNPTFEIASASVIDATNTAVNVTQNLGTDYTPASSASGTNGWEVSGDNGVTWNLVSTTHNSPTQIKLTHASLTTTNARLVRYLYGSNPPNVDALCGTPVTDPGPCFPPTNMTFDNSSLTLPLSPTTWSIRAAGTTTLPMATWRDVVTLAGNGGQVQTGSGIQLGPEQVRKFLVLSLAGPTLAVSNLTITPQDFLGNNVGTPIVLTNPSALASAGTGAPGISLYGVPLNSDNQNATTFSVVITFIGSPFQGTILQAWTIPFADLSSTTPTGANGSSTSSATTGTTSLTASAGGLIIAAAATTAAQSAGAYSFSGTDAGSSAIPMGLRWLIPSGIATMSGDGANVQTPGTASVTATFLTSGTVNIAAVAFR